jgi:hypothetical protein
MGKLVTCLQLNRYFGAGIRPSGMVAKARLVSPMRDDAAP